MIVAAIQMKASTNIDANLYKVMKMIKAAADSSAFLIVLPEYFSCYGLVRTMIRGSLRSKDILNEMKNMASLKKIYLLLAGMLFKDKIKRKMLNESLLISPEGKIIAKYRKRNLFKAKINGNLFGENKWIIPGKTCKVVPIDQNWKLGISTCFDLRFPDHYQKLKKLGANIISASSAFTETTGKAHWETLLRARAIETQSYIIAAALGSTSDNLSCHGNSMIVDPWGKIVAKANKNDDKILTWNISIDYLKTVRETIYMS